MRVRATQTGFLNNRRYREGAVFELVERKYIKTTGRGRKRKKEELTFSAKDQFSEMWMEELDDKNRAVETDDSKPMRDVPIRPETLKERRARVNVEKSKAATGDDDVI